MKNRIWLVGLQPVLLSLWAAVGAHALNPASFSGARAYLGNYAAIADFNHDGILDLATIDQSTSAIHIHAGMGNGKFAGDDIISLAASGTGAPNFLLATADLNGDGLPDLVVGVRSSTDQLLIQTLLGNASGGFLHGSTIKPTTGLVNFYLSDINGDGRLDLVVVGSEGAGVLPGNGDGTFQPEIEAFSQRADQPSGFGSR